MFTNREISVFWMIFRIIVWVFYWRNNLHC